MGCASSSPLVNGGPGGLVESAKTAATEIMTTSEKAMNDVGENISEQMTHAKETIVESINGVTHSITKKKDDAITEIPLKDPNDSDTDNHLIEENFENLKNEMLSKAQNAMDDAEKITDDLMKDTEDVIRDAETGIVDMKNEVMEKIDDVMEKSPTHSLDSLKTSVPEPEIENILNGGETETAIEATVGELEDINKEPTEIVETTTTMMEEMPAATMENEPVLLTPVATLPEQMESTLMLKNENDLVVEDVKSNENGIQNLKKLEKSLAIDEEESIGSDGSSVSDDDSQKKQVEQPLATKWEEMHDIYFKKRFSRPLHASVESLMEDEEFCTINLAKMYCETNDSNLKPMNSSPATATSPKLQKREILEKLSSDTLDVIDDLIKSIEKEVACEEMNEMNVEIPIVTDVE
ncbi:hypothetical protein PVAND_008627 [Polypedilum vanderplanki]|uniref:Uncharacterized protein n=1 Tax=Polypedilum vanderplanki TaxID=319348 RepID=A0A9J6CA62_POLVA|nr:hypothetical protein PVAND_008627 [Polypedilum vanderplanki]